MKTRNKILSLLQTTFAKLFYLIFLWFFIESCNKKEAVDPVPANLKIASIALKTSQPAGVFWAGESEPLNFTVDVTDDKGKTYQNYKGAVVFLANDKEITGNQFQFSSEINVNFKAKIGEITSSTSGNFQVKSPEKEIVSLNINNGFYQKFAVNQGVIGLKPAISIKGIGKNGEEIPIKKGLVAKLGTQTIVLDNYTFNVIGDSKFTFTAYGKSAETNFNIRPNNRSFAVVRIPLIFHFAKPGSFVNPNVNVTDSQYFEQVIIQLKAGTIITNLNKIFRNTLVKNNAEFDPNAADSFIEFYLAEKAPDGTNLPEKGINRLNFTKPVVGFGEIFIPNLPGITQYESSLNAELSKWNLNQYLNIVVETSGGGPSGTGKQPFIDNARKNSIPKEYFDLPISKTDERLFKNDADTRFFDHVRINGSINLLLPAANFADKVSKLLGTTLPHEIGHVFGLPHTFWSQNNCNESEHSDGLFDTPMHFVPNYGKSCDNINFTQRNVMNYLWTDQSSYFTYDQVTVMRSRMEAAFNIPTPANLGKKSGRMSAVNNVQKSDCLQ